MVVLGELMKVSAEKELDMNLDDLVHQIKKTKKITIHEPDMDELKRLPGALTTVRKHLWGMGPMDLLIVAHALNDRASHGLLTFDTKLMNHTGWSTIRKTSIWKEKFTITDYISI